jgi:hypothetical protein
MNTSVRRHLRRTKHGYVQVRRHERLVPFAGERGVAHAGYRTAIIVPSTDHDRPISPERFQRRVAETERFLSEKQGGFTDVNAVGGWVEHESPKDKGRLIKERTAEVVSYATRAQVAKSKADIERYVAEKRRAWRQSEVSYEFGKADLYRVGRKYHEPKKVIRR